jgi:type II secretory pathway component GspD/PulD (secretin)
MRKLNPLICGVVILGAQPVFADSTFNDKCPDIPACAKVVGEMLSQKYVFDEDVKGKVKGTPNLELTKDNAELLFTNMLYLEGFTRVPLGVPNSYQILRLRDAKDAAIPMVDASKDRAPDVPHLWDLYTLRYKASFPESVVEISRMARNFMPPYSRLIPSELDGTVLITDVAPNLKRIYELIRDFDQKPTPELKKKWVEEEKTRQEYLRHRATEERPQPRPEHAAPAPKKSS